MAANLQPSKVIAQLFGVSVRRIEQLKADGIITGQGRPTKYDLLPTIQAYIKYLSDKANGREQKQSVAEIEEEKLRAEADLKKSKAKVAEMQLKELEGTMHRSDDVAAMTTDLVYAIRSAVMALPGRLAMDIVQAQTAAEASVMIRAECYKILEELAGYEYDPEAYQRRVRDREGWTMAVDDETDE